MTSKAQTHELKVINAVIQNKDIQTLFSQAVDDLFVEYPDVWQSIKSYHSKYNGIPTWTEFSERWPDVEKVNVGELTEPYVDNLRESYISSKMDKSITQAAKDLDHKVSSPNVILGRLQKELQDLYRLTGAAEDTNIMDFDAAERHYDEVRERALAMGGQPGIPTGISFIDASYPTGFAPGDLIVMYGWTGRGKSLVSTLFACNAHEHNFKPMIVSLEMSAAKVRDRVYTIKGSGLFKNSDLMLGEYNIDKFRDFKKSQSDKSDFLVITNTSNGDITPNVVEAKIDQYKPQLIIVDYAQLASDNSGSENMTHRMMNMSKEYKALAMRKGVVIIIISSATAEGVGKQDAPPSITNVAWSRQLAYDADLAFAVHKYEGSDLIEVVCDKNRNGDLFAGSLEWDINAGIFKEVV